MPEETAFALTEEAGILTLTMSAPGNNLMTGAFFREYEAIMDQVQLRSTQPGIRGLVIRGGGRLISVALMWMPWLSVPLASDLTGRSCTLPTVSKCGISPSCAVCPSRWSAW